VILVAGGTGTLGTRLVPRLLGHGLPVRIFTRNPDRAGVPASGSVEVIRGDVRDRESVRRALEGVDIVVSAVHGFAGQGSSPAAVDRDGNVNLVDAASARGSSVVLMSIVGAAAGHPMDLMRMKYAAEEHLSVSRAPWTIVRATAYLETWTGLLEMTASRSGRPLVFGRGDNRINFVSAHDVAALVERAVLEPATRGHLIEIGGPEDLSLNQMAAALQQARGRSGRPRHVPRSLLRAVALGLRPLRPDLARQAQAALVMDTTDMAFDASAVRAAHPDLPSTRLGDLLAAGGAGAPASGLGSAAR
jgi:NADH dehydrogenase